MKEMKSPEINEIKKPEPENFKEIKPEKGMTAEKAREFWNKIFEKKSSEIQEDHWGPKYNTIEHMLAFVPPEDYEKGKWTGDVGESVFIPNDNTEAGREAKEELAKYNMNGIPYIKGEANFSKCAEISVKIDNMTEHRYSNFSEADKACAKKWNEIGKDGRKDWKQSEVKAWRTENEYTWHERCDTVTMDLVSRKIHNTEAGIFLHSGGCSECKTRDAMRTDEGGIFDE